MLNGISKMDYNLVNEFNLDCKALQQKPLPDPSTIFDIK
jgi:hypothetical protein